MEPWPEFSRLRRFGCLLVFRSVPRNSAGNHNAIEPRQAWAFCSFNITIGKWEVECCFGEACTSMHWATRHRLIKELDVGRGWAVLI
jgi:hypothetical protein